MIEFGIDRLLKEKSLQASLEGKRIGFIGHPASLSQNLQHSLDALINETSLTITAAFGPQHGMKGEKQDNMMETQDELDPLYQIPVFSLYGSTRRPTAQMLEHCDVLLFDLQDLGTRIYTFLTTLRYIMEEASSHKKELWILDRPNPIGRPIEGLTLLSGWESFVGAGPFPMRYGFTLGEAALYFKKLLNLKDLNLRIINMKNYEPNKGPGFGWPLNERSWVNPSPNAPNLNMARAFPGTVIIEGTTLSEMRGTTRSLEGLGAPDLIISEILKSMYEQAPDWMQGALIRPLYFEPTFQKHKGQLCQGFQFHTDHPSYRHELFKPYRVISLFLKVLRQKYKEYPIWRDFLYEYETDRKAIDVIQGGPFFREWVDDPASQIQDLESQLRKDEASWFEIQQEFLLY